MKDLIKIRLVQSAQRGCLFAAVVSLLSVLPGAGASAQTRTALTPPHVLLNLPDTRFPDGFMGLPFNAAVHAAGGSGPYRVFLSGDIPPGLNIAEGPTGIGILGTPSAPGRYEFRITVTDDLGGSTHQDYAVTIHPELVHPNLQQVTIADAEALHLSDTDNVFFPVKIIDTETIHADDGDDVFKDVMQPDVEVVHVNDVVSVTVTLGVSPSTAPAGAYGVAYSQGFSAVGNTGSATVSPSGTLPSGLCFSTTNTCPTGRVMYGSNIRIIGTPTQAGSFPFSLTAQDSAHTVVVNYTLVISPVSQTITLGAIPSPVYGGSSFTLTATASSGLTVSIASTSPLATGSNPFTPAGAGTATFRATQAGDGTHYAAATPVNFNVIIAPANLTLSAFSASRKFDHPNPNFFSIFSGFVNGDNASVVSGTTIISTTATPLSPVSGSPYAITPSTNNLSAANYTIQGVSANLTITPNSQIITFYKLPDLHVASNFPLSAVASSGLPVTYSVTGPAVISNNILGVTGLGTVTVTASQAGNSNYSAASAVARSFTAQ